jgi:hypothetical protein
MAAHASASFIRVMFRHAPAFDRSLPVVASSSFVVA